MLKLYFSGCLTGKQVACRTIAISALLSLIAVSISATPEQIPTPDCRFKTLTGYSCPSCGMTHSFHEFFTGHPGAAFHYNWMGPIFCITLLLILLKLSLELLTKKKTAIAYPKILTRIACLLIPGLWLTFWAFRFSQEYAQRNSYVTKHPQSLITCNSTPWVGMSPPADGSRVFVFPGGVAYQTQQIGKS